MDNPPVPVPGEPRLSRGQRVRGFARDLVVDRLCGRLGLRVLRLPRLARPRPKSGLGRRRVLVLAETVDCLLDATRTDVTATRIRHEVCRVTVVVAWWSAPWRGWTGRVGPLPGVLRQRVRFPARGRGSVTVKLALAQPVPLPDVLAAVLHALRPATAIEGDLGARPVAAALVVADEQRINPRGRRTESYRSDAPRLDLAAAASLLMSPEQVRNAPPWGLPGTPRWRRLSGGDLTWPTVTALRSVGTVDCGQLVGVDAVTTASLVAQLAMTGVVLRVPIMSQAVADLLAPELRAILAEPLPPREDGPLGQEIRSVRQRRAALRAHSVQFGALPAPTVSAILATKRTEHLPGILRAIAEQSYPELEIVLCLHGIELPQPCAEFLAHCGRPVEIVRVDGDVAFGIALGLATARASGSLITKFDDDDSYGPEHVWDLVLARGYSGATLVGKGIEFVHLEDADVTVRRRSGQPEADTDVVAGGTMLMARAELEQLGGWRPVPRSVDRGLLDRVNRAGARIYRTHPLGYLYHRRSQGHTWAADDQFFLIGARQQWPGLLQLAEFGTLGAVDAASNGGAPIAART